MSARRRIVIVGAGSCGCVVAERLTRDSTIDVILLEAGPAGATDDDLQMSRLPIDPASTRASHHPAAGGLDLPRGRGLGGSSAVNGGYFMRWHADDFAGWDERLWDRDTIARGYADLDGAESGGGAMSVRRIADDELSPWAVAFETHWQRQGYDLVSDVTPRVGVNRVRSNSTRSLRVPADRAFLGRAAGRSNLAVRTGVCVDRLIVDGARVAGVLLDDGESITADETILCAGSLASGALIGRSTGVAMTYPIGEHREVLVRFRVAAGVGRRSSAPLLPTVLHTEDRLELRCYNGDFADYIGGVPRSGPAIGVAVMAPRARGRLAVDSAGDQRVDLDPIDSEDAMVMESWAHRVADMLTTDDFARCVESGSVTVDSGIGTSQHAWGSLPMGVSGDWAGTDWAGSVSGVGSLRVIDGSILPTSGSSGPHETLMMTAARIAELMAGR